MDKVKIQDILVNMVRFCSPEYVDYIYAEVDEALASKISEILAEKCTIQESGQIVKGFNLCYLTVAFL